ncbi:MAG: hypothetical protein ACI8UO_003249 [Verrucomicrobiales bacterium]|jgi:hypothetical protein
MPLKVGHVFAVFLGEFFDFMIRSSIVIFVFSAVISGGALGAPPLFEGTVRPFLEAHCLACHGAEKQKGDLRLNSLTAEFDTAANADVWIEVMDNLNLDEMPPEDEPRPAAAEHAQIVAWIAEQLREASKRAVGSGGRVLLRRLNRAEYANTIRDLLLLPPYLPGEDPSTILPPDATYEGFDKAGSVLMLDPSLLDNYFMVAKEVASRVMVDGPPATPTQVRRFQFEHTSTTSGFQYVLNSPTIRERESDLEIIAGATRLGRGLFYPDSSLIFPVTGFYTVRIRAHADAAGVKLFADRINGREPRIFEVELSKTPNTYEVVIPFTALPNAKPASYLNIGILTGPKNLRTASTGHGEMIRAGEEAAKAGDFAEGLRIQARMLTEGYVDYTRPTEALLNLDQFPKMFLDWIEVEGPLYESWPPRSHANLLFKGADAELDEDYVREIFARLLPRAFRRPVEESEIEKVVALVAAEMEHGAPFQEAVEFGLTYVLTSPDFLYLLEPEDHDQPRPLDDYELASRLSYFLWSSMPDQALFDAAESGGIRDDLAGQVSRMLADPKSRALTEGFAAQWLRTSDFQNFAPDSKVYRGFDQQLPADMVRETESFFAEVLTKNLSIFEFLDSDFAMVNERLAAFYGLLPVKGSELRRVSLPADSHRGGLLGQAGIHLSGSDGIRTKPVTRGVWIREVLFNDPPAPPPPNAGEVEPNIKGEQLTVRERLLQHQKIEACANCHRGIDPYGLALENFDATGAWRTHQNGEEFRGDKTPPIVSSGKLPNGQQFADFEEFKTLLRKQEDRFRRAFAEKLFLYAIGRPLEATDRIAIDAVASQLAENGDTIQSAIQALVQSEAFLTK